MENTLEMTLEQAIAEMQDFAKGTSMFVGSPKAAKIAEYLQELVDSRITIKRLGTELKADHQKAIDTANELTAYKDKTYISEDFLARNGFEKREYAFRYYGDCAIIRKSGFLYCDDCAEISVQEIDSEAGEWRIEVAYLDGGSTQTLDVCTVGQMRMFLAIEGLTEIAKQLK